MRILDMDFASSSRSGAGSLLEFANELSGRTVEAVGRIPAAAIVDPPREPARSRVEVREVRPEAADSAIGLHTSGVANVSMEVLR